MAQYLMSVHGNEEEYAKVPEDQWPEMFAAVEAFNQQLQSDGVWVFAGGLQGAETATVVDASGDAPVITDGPYLETKEHIGGFWVIEVPDLDAALRYATAGSQACQGKVEVRPFQGEPETPEA
ncbi:YciI family protein [Nocardioides caeni]|uniref:YCII-related domain-containing protein n=1 Tax=Nocardioides caeni TaxID=574700 RepID=A0A4S8MZQ6_9ACTN|nr:YciI family protein [Nocardioides caeni]THV08977.1 hypothetical protein E9934_17980 [Nocardioides caeni]